MLISKKTWCFACPSGTLHRKPIERDATFFIDTCDTCAAQKYTAIHSGVINYVRGKRNATSFEL